MGRPVSPHGPLLLVLAACLMAAGCLRDDRSCASDANCAAFEACVSGVCVEGARDLGPNTLDAGSDGGEVVRDAAKDAAADAADAADDSCCEVLARGWLSQPADLSLTARGDLVVVHTNLFTGEVGAHSFTPGGESKAQGFGRLEGGINGVSIASNSEAGDLLLFDDLATGRLLSSSRAWDVSSWSVPREFTSPADTRGSVSLQFPRLAYQGERLNAMVFEITKDSNDLGTSFGVRPMLLRPGEPALETIELAEGSDVLADYDSEVIELDGGELLMIWSQDGARVIARVLDANARLGDAFVLYEPVNSDDSFDGGLTAVARPDGGAQVVFRMRENDVLVLRSAIMDPQGEVSVAPVLASAQGSYPSIPSLVADETGQGHVVYQDRLDDSSGSKLMRAAWRDGAWERVVLDEDTGDSGLALAAWDASSGEMHVVYLRYDGTNPRDSELKYMRVNP